MFDTTYSDVSVVWLVGPWVVAVGFLLLWISKAMGYKRITKELKKYVGVEGQWSRDDFLSMITNLKKERDKAQAEAREATAAHQECVRKLRKLDEIEDALRHGDNFRFEGSNLWVRRQERDKNGKFKRKMGAKKILKKAEKPRARK